MTITTAPVGRVVIDLGAEATVLEAAQRLADAPAGHDVALVVAAGAPVARNAVFLEVLRRRAGDRRLIVVSADGRARSLAASVHLRTFASLAALERHELDATEQLGDARRAALATLAAATSPRRGFSAVRAFALFVTLLTAAAILAGVVVPRATVIVAPALSAIGPYEYDLRAGPGGDINDALTLGPSPVTKKLTVTASGSRSDDIKATGVERFTNLTTNDIRIPKGTIVQTTDNPPIRFETTEEKVLGRSTLLPLSITSITINIQAVDAGPRGNVAQDRITRSPSLEYSVTNPVPTANGETRKFAIVMQADYDNVVKTADAELKNEAEATLLKKWKDQETPKQRTVYGTFVKRLSITPANEVVKDLPIGITTVEVTVAGEARAYSVPATEPQRTALKKLADEAPPENEVDTGTRAKVDIIIPANVDENGVHWRVRASSIQYRHFPAQFAAALAGRSLDEARAVADARGFGVTTIELWPSWWPRMPVLESRITIAVGQPSATASGP